MMSSSVRIRPLGPDDPELISAAFDEIGWDKATSKYQQYLADQNEGSRTVLVAVPRMRPLQDTSRSIGVPPMLPLPTTAFPRFRISTSCLNTGDAALVQCSWIERKRWSSIGQIRSG